MVQDPTTYEPTRFGTKLHKTFMAEVGEEMCQAELAHHANHSPESLLSRKIKEVYLYKRARAVDLQDRKSPESFPNADNTVGARMPMTKKGPGT